MVNTRKKCKPDFMATFIQEVCLVVSSLPGIIVDTIKPPTNS